MRTILFKNSRTLITASILFILSFLAVVDSANAGRWARDENGKVYDIEKKWEERKEVEHRQDARVAEIAATQPNVWAKYVANFTANTQAAAQAYGAIYDTVLIDNLSDWINKECGSGATNPSCLRTGWVVDRNDWTFTADNGQLIIIRDNRMCIGWGCVIGSLDKFELVNNGFGNNVISVPPVWVPPPGFTPPQGPRASRAPSPIPTAADIIWFEITNFRLQTALNDVDYYQVLKEQMAVNHENYQLNLAWGVRGASSCQASCKYVKIDDYLANQNWDELQAQSWPCSNNIDNQTTFSGDVDKEYGSAKTKPRENGIIRYTLSCQGETGSDRKDLLAVVQSFSWFEAIPIIDQ